MPESKKKSTPKASQSKTQSSSDLPQKLKSKKADLKKKEQVEALTHAPKPSVEKSPSKDLARKAKSKKEEHHKQELIDALAYHEPTGAQAASGPSEVPEKKFFQDLGAKIAQRAYELHERRGKIHGHDLEDWLEAERQIFAEDHG